MNTAAQIAYARALGANLRAARESRGLSLAGVQAKSDGEWLAVVVGSYERGDRNPTVVRLAAYCDWLCVPVAQILPDTDLDAAVAALAQRVVFEADRLCRARLDPPAAEPEPVVVPVQRQDAGGAV